MAQAAAEHQDDVNDVRNRRAWVGWTIQIVCLIYAAFVLFENIQECIWRWPTTLVGVAGSYDATFSEEPDTSGFHTVDSVKPGSAMATAGVVKGDLLRFDVPSDLIRRHRAGEISGFTMRHGGQTTHHVVAAKPRSTRTATADDWIGLAYASATNLAALFGAYIIWRSRRVATTMLLGMALLTYGLITSIPQLRFSGTATFPLFDAIGLANLAAIPVLFWAFAVGFYTDHVARPKLWERMVLAVYAALAAVVAVAVLVDDLTDRWSLPGTFQSTTAAVFPAGFIVCLGYMVLGWRRSTASVQQRYALLLVATSAIICAQVLDYLILPIVVGPLQTFHFIANALLTGVIGSGLFTYSILRHRVLDLGFAVNRTLVYGMVSAILLAAFGLIEWAVDHFVPIQGREKNAIVDALIAVGVFLTFHRVRDLVERVIEGLFFRSWQKAEAALRRFVREAAFITDSGELTKAFVKALSKYARTGRRSGGLPARGAALRAGRRRRWKAQQAARSEPAVPGQRARRPEAAGTARRAGRGGGGADGQP
jgi:hypothetical protein